MKGNGKISKFSNLILVILAAVICIGCSAKPAPVSTYLSSSPAVSDKLSSSVSGERAVKNVIFCIGDGMGLGQVAIARIRAAGVDGKLYMEQLPITGIVRTHSADSIVTDSAAAATALADGVKTNNGMVGETVDGKKYQTILDAAKAKGMASGLIATSPITDATPACFAAHVKSRKMEDKIAEQLIEDKITVLFGGGREYFLPAGEAHSKRTDTRNLIEEAKSKGYTYIQNAEELRTVKGEKVLGLFQEDALTTEPPEPNLAELTKKAIEILNRQKEGFFLMVEGSQIDWKCHNNDAKSAIEQILDFDEAVKAAVEFAKQDGQTLVIVIADHETGGLTIKGGSLDGNNLDLNWSTRGHSGTPIVMYVFGPKAEEFSGVYDNTEIPRKLAKLLGIQAFPKAIE
jgi:alkaline phosphatase